MSEAGQSPGASTPGRRVGPPPKKVPFWRQLLFGGPQRLGWWTLPVFLIVGLAGAVLAGSLTVVYYSQQVRDLRVATQADRSALEQAADEVLEVKDEALAEMEQAVSQIADQLDTELPVTDAPIFGAVAIRGGRVFPEANQAPPQQQPAPEASEGQAAASVGEPRLVAAQEGEPSETQEPSPSPTPSPTPTQTARPRPPERVGSGFAVARDGADVFFATTHEVVSDPNAPGGVLELVEVITANGTFVGAVHAWDAGRDLALVRAQAGDLAIPRWRNFEEPLRPNDRLLVVGVTPTLNSVLLEGQVGFADVSILVSDIPRLDLLRGAPIVDSSGRIVAVASSAYRPFGAAGGGDQADPPVRLLCETLLRNCEDLTD